MGPSAVLYREWEKEGGRWTLLCLFFLEWPLKLDGDWKGGGFTVRGGGVERLPRLRPSDVRCACALLSAEIRVLWLRASSRKPDLPSPPTEGSMALDHPSETPNHSGTSS